MRSQQVKTSRFFGAGSDDSAAALLARLRALQRTAPTSGAETCAICLGALARETRLDCCTHVFCYDCIAAWTQQTSRCPLCKRTVAVITEGLKRCAVEPRELRVDWLGDDAALFAFEDEEETPCMVCGLDDDEASLLLCDGPGCDATCHVVCAGLAAVPACEWFCTRCSPAEAPPAEQVEPEEPQTQGAAADTSAFERFRWTQPGAR